MGDCEKTAAIIKIAFIFHPLFESYPVLALERHRLRASAARHSDDRSLDGVGMGSTSKPPGTVNTEALGNA